jgi:5-methyltetrahydropteroyltriglutamate--homocysteine methyltransferase
MTRGITTTHIGSLPRSPEILEHLEESVTGELPGSLVGDATQDVIERQADIGIDIVNNGEQGRTGFHIHVLDRLSGFEGEGVAPFWGDVREYPELAEAEFNYPDADPETGAPLRPAVTGPIEYQGKAAAREELETFFERMNTLDVDVSGTFITAPSPGIVATSLPNQYYSSHEEYLFAVADALQTEYELIADSGATLQIDAPDLMHTYHREFHDGRGFQDLTVAEYREVVSLHVEAINRAIDDIPAGEIRLHTCWGNYEGPHHRDIALSDVLPELYDLNIGYLAVEGASPRHAHEYRAFVEHPLPDDMQFMPGVVDVKTNIIEHPETVADRIERAIEAIGSPSRIVAAPDCGFGTLAWSSAVEDIAWAKLDALVRGAELASERFE